MNIFVNTRLLLPNQLDGIRRFVFETLKRITIKHKEHKFYFLFDRDFSEECIFSDNIIPIRLFPPARHVVLNYLYLEWAMKNILKKHNNGLFFSPDGCMPLNINMPAHIVIHDLNFETYPELLPFIERKYYKYYFPKFASQARRIATVSDYSKKDIIDKYNVSESNIDVVYNGISSTFNPIDKKKKELIKQKYSQGSEYFVCVGSINARKNIVNLIRAFYKFKNTDEKGIKLIFAGEKKWWDSDMEDAFHSSKFKEEIIFTGRISDNDMNDIIGASYAMLYVSLFEGFGIPILEAFMCEVPVIVSDTTSMPEVAGDAGLYVDPLSINSISLAMNKLASDDDLRNKLITAGISRKECFSWDKTSDLLWKSIEKAIC